MTIKDLVELEQLTLLNNKGNLDNKINGIFACDLLSHVMGHCEENSILITVLNNINVLGVASLLDLSCVIFTHNTKVSEDILNKANELEIPLLSTNKSTSETVIILHELGIKV